MSWSEDFRSEHRCPCGKGTWVEITESDDWSRSRKTGEINCPDCRKTHRIEEFQESDRKGLKSSAVRVVPRKLAS